MKLPHHTCSHLPLLYTYMSLVITGLRDNTLNTCGGSEDTSSLLMVFITQYNSQDANRMSLTKLMKNNSAFKKHDLSLVCLFFHQ